MKIKKCKIFEKGMFFKLQFRKIAEDLKSWRENLRTLFLADLRDPPKINLPST